jgi:predicted nucleic acid-binding protein
MAEFLLDADSLIEILKRNQPTTQRAEREILQFGRLVTSAIAFYEVTRGLDVRRAMTQQQRLTFLEPQLTILPVDRRVAERAAQIYTHLRRENALLPDADVLIGATALVGGFSLATANQAHYQRIPGLSLADWRTG